MSDATWRIPPESEGTGANATDDPTGTQRILPAHDATDGGDGTARIPAAPGVGVSGTVRIDQEPPRATASSGGVRHPLGLLPPGARLCADAYTVIETLRPHERMLPGLYHCRADDGQEVMVKVAAMDLPPDAVLWALLAELEHSCVVNTHVTRLLDGFYYEVQEYCNAGTLYDMVPTPGSGRPPFPYEALPLLVQQLSSGLAYLHGKGVVHRDLKPKNIYLKRGADQRLIAVIGDFDISSVLVSDQTSRATSRAGGTWIYTAPESFPRYMDETGRIGAQVTRAGDYYALGMCLIELLLGTTSLHTCGLTDLYDFYLQGHRVVVPEQIPRKVTVLLRGLLMHNRHHRWGAEEIQRWLHDANTPEDLEQINADERYSVKRAVRPYRMRQQVAYDLPGLAVAMAMEPGIALDDLLSGDYLIQWVSELDTNVAREMRQLRNRYQAQPQRVLWCAVLCCDPNFAFRCHDGAEVKNAVEWFEHTCALVDARKVTYALAFSDESLLTLAFWLGNKAQPETALARRVELLTRLPETTRRDECQFLLYPDQPFRIDDAHAARTPAEFAQFAYGTLEEWRNGPPAVYEAAFTRWQQGALYGWLRQFDMGNLIERCEEISRELSAHPYAAFETILRLLDPALPPVEVEFKRQGLQRARVIPYHVVGRYDFPYRTIGRGIPFGYITHRADSDEVVVENTLITRREGTATIVVDIKLEPLDCDVHPVYLNIESGFVKLRHAPTVFLYRMDFPTTMVTLYLISGAVLGALFYAVPRFVVHVLSPIPVSNAVQSESLFVGSVLGWLVVFFVIIVEIVVGRLLWNRALLAQSEARAAAEHDRQLVQRVSQLDMSGVDDGMMHSGCSGVLLVLVAVAAVLSVMMNYAIAGLDSVLSCAGYLPFPPTMNWGLWGLLFGSVCGFWHVAPIFNLQRWRIPVLAATFAVLATAYLICAYIAALPKPE